MCLHHHGEDEAVEHDIVLADEVNETGFLVLPPFLPTAPFLGFFVAEFLCVGDVADGCVKPYVEHLSLGSFHGYGYTPFQVAGHGAGLEVHVEPALALAVYIGTPFLVSFENPLLQPLLVFAQWQVPVLGGFLHESMPGVVLVGGIDQLVGRERGTTFLALVTVSTLGSAAWTGAHDVAVGEELSGHLVAVLQFGVLLQFTLVIEGTEEIRGKLVVNLRGGAAVDVERDAEVLEGFLDEVMVAVHHLLYGDALLTGTDGDGHSMLVASADKHYFLLLQSEIAGVDVGRHVDACQMADMHTAIGVGQGGSDGGTFEILFFHCIDSVFLVFLFCLQNY